MVKAGFDPSSAFFLATRLSQIDDISLCVRIIDSKQWKTALIRKEEFTGWKRGWWEVGEDMSVAHRINRRGKDQTWEPAEKRSL